MLEFTPFKTEMKIQNNLEQPINETLTKTQGKGLEPGSVTSNEAACVGKMKNPSDPLHILVGLSWGIPLLHHIVVCCLPSTPGPPSIHWGRAGGGGPGSLSVVEHAQAP